MAFAQDIINRAVNVNWGGSKILVLNLRFEAFRRDAAPDPWTMKITSAPFDLTAFNMLGPILTDYPPPSIATPKEENELTWTWPMFDETETEEVDQTYEVIDRAIYYGFDYGTGILWEHYQQAELDPWIPFLIDYTGDTSGGPPGLTVLDGTNPTAVTEYMAFLNVNIPGAINMMPYVHEILESHMEGGIVSYNSRTGGICLFLNVERARALNPDLETFDIQIDVVGMPNEPLQGLRIMANLGLYGSRAEFAVDDENLVINPNQNLIVDADAEIGEGLELRLEDGWLRFTVDLAANTIESEQNSRYWGIDD